MSGQGPRDPRRDGPAVPVERSVTPEFLYCLEDGKPFKALTRYLRARYALTPAQYRARWGLPDDYPMIAPQWARRNLGEE